MTDRPSAAPPPGQINPRQGCLKIAGVTALRLLIHFVVFVLLLLVLVHPVRTFLRYFEQQELKVPALTVAVFNLSHAMIMRWFIILPILLALDAAVLLALQSLAKPWRYLARLWFSAVLLAALLLFTVIVFSMAVPFEATLVSSD